MTHIAVIDIGKTNAKLALVDGETLAEIAVMIRPNRPLPGPPWPHTDLDGHWQFFLRHLSAFHKQHGIDAISVTTHGAAAVLLDRQGRSPRRCWTMNIPVLTTWPGNMTPSVLALL